MYLGMFHQRDRPIEPCQHTRRRFRSFSMQIFHNSSNACICAHQNVRHSFEATVYHALDCKLSKLGCKYIVMHACRLCSLLSAAFADVQAAAQGTIFVHSHNSRPSVSLDNFAQMVTGSLVSTVVSLLLACPRVLLDNIHDAACLYDCSEMVWYVLNLQQE